MSKCSQEFLSLADDCLHQFAQTESDKLSSILTSDDHNSFHASYPGCRVRDFPPIKTLSLFMRQVASDTKSCRHALIDEARDQVVKSNKNKVPNTQTSAYCKARQRLTEASIRGLLRTSGNSLDHASPESWLWNQRRVLLTDGSTLLMPDTEKNQEEYPQPGTQQKGLGFPILRILVLICLGSDALLDFAVAAYEGKKTGEQALLRKLFSHLHDGDILLGDANFENYFLLALLLQAKADVVFKKNGARHLDFRKCDQKLGSKDGLFKLKRPVRPGWMSQELYDQMPTELVIRAVKNKRRTIVTTLLDAKEYPRTEIIALYLKRWHVEIDFDVIKTTMKMDMLRCKSPEMVRKEISINFLVYNLMRTLMGKTAKHIDKTPREVSFNTAQETLVSFLQPLLGASGDWLEQKIVNMLDIIGQHIVGNRPGRSEPRAVKRRPKPHKKLQHPRSQARLLKQYQGK